MDRPDLASAQALTCAESLVREGSAVATWLGQALDLPEPGDGPEAWSQFLIRWALAVHSGALAPRALAAAVALAEHGLLPLADIEVAARVILTTLLAEIVEEDEERRAVTEIDKPLAAVLTLRPATAREEAEVQDFRDAIAEAFEGGRVGVLGEELP